MADRAIALRPRLRVERGSRGRAAPNSDDRIAVEEPLEIRAGGEPLATTMRTPGDDHELAVGFLLAEGLIESARDIGTVTHCGRISDPSRENTIDVRPGPGMAFDLDRVGASRRGTLTTAACGVCGRMGIDDLLQHCAPLERATRLPLSLLEGSIEALRNKQPRFELTGGLHGAAILDAGGAVLAAREDVGRHNAVDKVVGALILQAATAFAPMPEPAVLAVSGRVSFEIVQKAARARIPVVCGASAPTSLAIDLAEAMRITLAAFVRPEGLNLYAHAEGVDLEA